MYGECLPAPSLRLSLQPAFCCFSVKPALVSHHPILTRSLAHASLARSTVTEAHTLGAHWTSPGPSDERGAGHMWGCDCLSGQPGDRRAGLGLRQRVGRATKDAPQSRCQAPRIKEKSRHSVGRGALQGGLGPLGKASCRGWGTPSSRDRRDGAAQPHTRRRSRSGADPQPQSHPACPGQPPASASRPPRGKGSLGAPLTAPVRQEPAPVTGSPQHRGLRRTCAWPAPGTLACALNGAQP